MADFDPDAYLAQQPTATPAAFNPDAYLASKPATPAEKPGVLSRIGAGLAGVGAGAAEMLGLGAPVEVAEYAAGRQPAAHLPVAGPYGATEAQVKEVERQAGEQRKAVQQAGGVGPFVVQGITQPFQKLGGAIVNPPQTLGQAYDVGKAVPQAAATLEAGAGAARGAIAGAGQMARAGSKALNTAMPAKPIAVSVKNAREAGYVIKPSEGGGKVGTVLEGVTSSPRLSIEAAVKNQRTTNRLVNEELGLPANTQLTPAKIRELKVPHNAVYKEVSELGPIATDETYVKEVQGIGRTPGTSFTKVRNPDLDALREAYTEAGFDAKDAVLHIRQLRRDGGKNLKNLDPAKNELGYAQRQIADALETQIERHAQAIGQDDLVSRFRNARRELAKINNVADAMSVSTGDISAMKLAKARSKGAPLSGKLQTIADTHDAFPSEMRDQAKLRNKVPVTALEGVAGGVGGVTAAATRNPLLGVGAAASIAARPLTRKFLLSEAYQSRLAPGPARNPPTLVNTPRRPGKQARQAASKAYAASQATNQQGQNP